MTLTFDPRARLLLLVLLFVIAGGVVGVMTFQRLHESRDSSPAALPAPHKVVAKPAAPRPAAKTSAKPRPATPSRPRTHAAAPVGFADKLPLAIRHALAADQIVVVALYDPRAKIDGTALAEAQQGASLAGSAFVKVDVRTHGVDSLNAKYGAVHDPAVLVLRPPDQLVVRIDGFADRDTVAQAALNAAS